MKREIEDKIRLITSGFSMSLEQNKMVNDPFEHVEEFIVETNESLSEVYDIALQRYESKVLEVANHVMGLHYVKYRYRVYLETSFKGGFECDKKLFRDIILTNI